MAIALELTDETRHRGGKKSRRIKARAWGKVAI